MTGGVVAILIAAWGEEVLGGKILLLRKTHPVLVLWNKQASAVMTKRGQWIQSRPPFSLVPFFQHMHGPTREDLMSKLAQIYQRVYYHWLWFSSWMNWRVTLQKQAVQHQLKFSGWYELMGIKLEDCWKYL